MRYYLVIKKRYNFIINYFCDGFGEYHNNKTLYGLVSLKIFENEMP